MKLGIQTARAILNSLSAHVAILNKNGIIIETNRAWKQFARSNKIRIRPDTIHINYLEICDTALDDQSGKAQQVSEGIRSLINGEIDEFLTEYPCHGPEKKRWFYMRATRLADSDPLQLVVSHEDITQIKLAETALKKREKELEIQKTNHEETITALKVLLKQRDADRQELEERFVSNIREMVCPYIDKLSEEGLHSRHQTLIDIINHHIDDIMSPLLKKLSSRYYKLTPQELRVASLVRSGNTSKEISHILCISTNAVNFHRKNIRIKLGLTREKINLQTHLLTMDK